MIKKLKPGFVEILETKDFELLSKMNEGIQTLHHQLYPDIFKPFDLPAIRDFFERILNDPDAIAFVALEDKEPIGYCLVFIKKSEENPFQYGRKFLLLDQIFVVADSQNKGIGRALLEKVSSLAKSLGVFEIELNHWTTNETARHFFKKNGFVYRNERMHKILPD